MIRLLALIFCLGVSICIKAQTYRYRYIYSVRTDGSKFDKWANEPDENAKSPNYYKKITHYTFTDSKRICYESHADGTYATNFMGGKIIFDYSRAANGMYFYKARNGAGEILRFSTDFKRYNFVRQNDVEVYIYEPAKENFNEDKMY